MFYFFFFFPYNWYIFICFDFISQNMCKTTTGHHCFSYEQQPLTGDVERRRTRQKMALPLEVDDSRHSCVSQVWRRQLSNDLLWAEIIKQIQLTRHVGIKDSYSDCQPVNNSNEEKREHLKVGTVNRFNLKCQPRLITRVRTL